MYHFYKTSRYRSDVQKFCYNIQSSGDNGNLTKRVNDKCDTETWNERDKIVSKICIIDAIIVRIPTTREMKW